jgi:hypothetical protein
MEEKMNGRTGIDVNGVDAAYSAKITASAT